MFVDLLRMNKSMYFLSLMDKGISFLFDLCTKWIFFLLFWVASFMVSTTGCTSSITFGVYLGVEHKQCYHSIQPLYQRLRVRWEWLLPLPLNDVILTTGLVLPQRNYLLEQRHKRRDSARTPRASTALESLSRKCTFLQEKERKSEFELTNHDKTITSSTKR